MLLLLLAKLNLLLLLLLELLIYGEFGDGRAGRRHGGYCLKLGR